LKYRIIQESTKFTAYFLQYDAIHSFTSKNHFISKERHVTRSKASHRNQEDSTKENSKRTDTPSPGEANPKIRSDRKYDSALLFVHGIGNQKEGDVLKNMANPVAKHIIRVAEKYGWQTDAEQETSSSPIVITARKINRTKTTFLDECIWANSFPRMTFWEFVKWALARISSPIVLLIPDKDDIQVIHRELELHNYFNVNAPLKLAGVFFRFLFRLFLLFGVSLFIFASLLLSLQFLLNSSTGVRVATILLFLVAISCLVLLHKKLNYFAHVPAAIMPAHGQYMLNTVKDAVERTCRLTKRPALIAHSQGGFLAYHALKDFSTKKRPKWRLFGVGSGLRPITFLDRLNNRWALSLWWVASLYAFLAIGSFLALLNHADFGENLRSTGIHLYFISRAILGLPLSSAEINYLSEPLRQQSHTFLSQVFYLLQDTIPLPLATILLGIFWIIANRSSNSPLLFDRIPPLKCVSNWTEVTTSHDLVGRLSLAPLPLQVRQQDTSGASNVILDHISYFKTSILPLQIAIEALGDAQILTKSELDRERDDINTLNTQLNALSQRRWHLTSFIISALSATLFIIYTFINGYMSWAFTIIYLSLAVTIVSIPCRLIEIALSRSGPLKPPSETNIMKQRQCISAHYNRMILVGSAERCLGAFLAVTGMGSILATYIAQDIVMPPETKVAISPQSISNLWTLGILALFGGVAVVFKYRLHPFLSLGLELYLSFRIVTAPSDGFSVIKPGLPAVILILFATTLIFAIQCSRSLTQQNSTGQRG